MEKITRFDLFAAFKALDEIETPEAGKIKANRPVLNESLKPLAKTDCLLEDYYDINDQADLNAAKEAREDEVAKAKLARIEKIVDLDADSPEDLLPSYVGKTIIQCPQCMTLFYKDAEDIEHSEDDPNTVNIGEVCQHCGNDQGYTIIGKVAAEEVPAQEAPAEENTEVPSEDEFPAVEAEQSEGGNEAEEESDLNLNFEEPVEGEEEKSEEAAEENKEEEKSEESEEEKKDEEEEEKKEEAFTAPSGEVLTEAKDDDLNKKLAAHNRYIQYLQDEIAAKQKALEEEENEEIKESIKDCISGLQQKLTDSLPDSLKAEKEVEELPTPEDANVSAENKEEEKVEDDKKTESLHESVADELARFEASLKADSGISEGKEEIDAYLDDLDEGCKKEELKESEVEAALNAFVANLGESCEKCEEACENCDEALDNGEKEDCEDGKCEEACCKEEVCPDCGKKVEECDCKKELKESDVQAALAAFEAGLDEACGKCGDDCKDCEGKEELKEASVEAEINSFIAGLDEKLVESSPENAVPCDDCLKNEEEGKTEIFTELPDHFVEVEQKGDKVELEIVPKASEEGQEIADQIEAAKEDDAEEIKAEDEAVEDTNEDKSEDTDEDKAEDAEFEMEEPEENIEESLKEDGETCNINDFRVPQANNASFKAMLNDPTFKAFGEDLKEDADLEEELPQSVIAAGNEVEADLKAINAEDEKYIEHQDEERDVEELNDSFINKAVSGYLTEVYSNVNDFVATGCSYNNDKLIIEGTINFKSGKTKTTEFTFNKVEENLYEGYNKDLAGEGKFTLKTFKEDGGRVLMAESLSYKYNIGENLVEGLSSGR